MSPKKMEDLAAKKVGVWIRVSSEEQAKGESPEHHEARARLYAASKDWQVVEVYHLEGVSGKSVIDHPEAQRMMKDVKAGRITGLIFSKLARLARNTKELLDFADYFQANGADLVSLQESIDTSTPAGRFFYTLIAALASWEREEIGSRIAASIPIRAKLGKQIAGPAPFGYQWKDKKLIPHPEEAPVRRLIHELFLKYRRLQTVARHLNEAGYRTRQGKPYFRHAIEVMMRDPTPNGLHRANYKFRDPKTQQWKFKPESDWVFRPVEAILAPGVWDACANLMKEADESRKPRAKRTVHLFAGLLYCGCGEKMYIPSNTPKYVCQKCRTKIPAGDLEDIFIEQLKSYILSPSELSGYLAAKDSELGAKESELTSLETERKKVAAEMEKLYRLYLDDGMSSDGFGGRYKPLEERLGQLNDESVKLQAAVDFLKVDFLSGEQIMTEARSLAAFWPDMSREAKRRVIESVVQRITLSNDEIQLDLCYLPTLTPSHLHSTSNDSEPSDDAETDDDDEEPAPLSSRKANAYAFSEDMVKGAPAMKCGANEKIDIKPKLSLFALSRSAIRVGPDWAKRMPKGIAGSVFFRPDPIDNRDGGGAREFASIVGKTLRTLGATRCNCFGQKSVLGNFSGLFSFKMQQIRNLSKNVFNSKSALLSLSQRARAYLPTLIAALIQSVSMPRTGMVKGRDSMLRIVTRRPSGWLAVLLMAMTLAAAPSAVQADTFATYVAPGPGSVVSSHFYSPQFPVPGLQIMDIGGTQYKAFCLDMFSDLTIGQSVLVDGVITPTTSPNVDWSAVEYIMFAYGDTTDPLEAAAANCAIWYFTSAPYGPYLGTGPGVRYQFMTDSGPPAVTTFYDGWDGTSEIRDRAFEMINSVPRNSSGICTFLVPNDLILTAANNQIFFMAGQTPSTTVGANVLDTDGNPVAGVTVTFTTDLGTLSAATGVTDANGNAFVTITNSASQPGVSMVCASVPGYNSVFLNGKVMGPNVQDLGILPVETDNSACVEIEWMLKEKCYSSCGKICSLTFCYTGESSGWSCYFQNPCYVSCKDYYTTPKLPDCVRICVTDKDSPYMTGAKIFFDGIVKKGDEFTALASKCGLTCFPSDLRIVVLETTGCKILQVDKFRCTCTDPLWTGDKFGCAQLIDCDCLPADDPNNCYNRDYRCGRRQIVNCFKQIYNNWCPKVRQYCHR